MQDGKPFTKNVVKMLSAVRLYRRQADQCRAPLLVHCSAGVGRTGCFIVIDQAFRYLEKGARARPLVTPRPAWLAGR
jgi:protein tyrosine phosphatase